MAMARPSCASLRLENWAHCIFLGMKHRLHYGTTAKVLHWTVVGLLVVQYSIGWLMSDIKRGMNPGVGMTLHVSIGTTILVVIVARLAWRLTHPVGPESSLAPWQRVTSEAVHWLLYVMILATTLSGWLFASARGWTISWFFIIPMPMLTPGDAQLVRAIDGVHQDFEWALLALIGLHVASAFLHLLYYRNGVMGRMLPSSVDQKQ
jgi:cytochrome b561